MLICLSADSCLFFCLCVCIYIIMVTSVLAVPPPPRNLEIQVRSGKNALVSWEPPLIGKYSAFKLKVIPLSEPQDSTRNVVIKEAQLPFNLRDLTPGASYELQLYTVYEKKESDAYISSNFTTRKLLTWSMANIFIFLMMVLCVHSTFISFCHPLLEQDPMCLDASSYGTEMKLQC